MTDRPDTLRHDVSRANVRERAEECIEGGYTTAEIEPRLLLRLLDAALATPDPAPSPEGGLDVERLAAAICNAEAVRGGRSLRYDDFDDMGRAIFRDEAFRLAREYAALGHRPSLETE